MDSKSYAFGFDGSAAGVANVALMSPGRNSTSASRICPTKVEGVAPGVTTWPTASAETTRVNARTPRAKPGSSWLKQMELYPSDEVQIPSSESACSMSSADGLSMVPETPVQTESES